ncbi:MAG: ATP-grasp domain-containing protein, partial [Calditrichaeota bacterium]|nr:ATP-grasp domain-containing protein [Calditrichota bacterium]
ANKNSEIRRFFVHHGIREYPITGGPVCFLQSVHNKDMFEFGKRIIEAIKFSGLAQMEFMIDQDDNIPKLTEVNARFYGATCGAINAGIDLPDALYRIATNGDVETVIDYPAGVKTRYLLYSDTKHMLSVLRGEKSPKYKLGKIKTLINYLNFFGDDGYYVVSMSDPMPMIKKILNLNTD